MKIEDHWPEIQTLFEKAVKSNKYVSIATVDKSGNPHITPIGSLVLNDDCTGFFSERFPVKMVENFKYSDRVSVMAVNTGFFYWFKAIRRGKFESPPGVRLYGSVGEPREPTPQEADMWQERVKFARGTKGHGYLWKGLSAVRDIRFDDFKPVTTGKMTQGLWNR
ncbi:MAG: pyridoxamine 5'-phosphate oxidase family protein [Desulfobacterales bacterium]|nr:pyridoxamine 5'-phosphate oxidase family protein [Desulfobacterales bacterium]